MSTVFDEIASAFENRLDIYQSTNVAYPNVKFKPKKGTGYLEPILFTGEPVQAGLGDNGTNKQIGQYDVLIWEPVGAGLGDITRKADELVTHFPRGLDITKNTTVVRIEKSWPSGMTQHGDWVLITVTIRWYAHTAN